ncbi:MAG: Rieske (2Fe-2S) protein [Candidatus Xenobia bacterium]
MVLRFKPADVPPGERIVLEVDDMRSVAVFNLDGEFYAIDNLCPHRGGPLGDGWVEHGVVTCPWHGWEFEIKTGQSTAFDHLCQAVYPVRVVGDEGEVEIP